MATTYKTFSANDIVSTRTLLHEAIPLTGTIISGTYVNGSTETNIKDYTHGMFQSVYDYPYLSSSANHIFDMTVGVSSQSSLYSSVTVQKDKKKNVYNQMAQVLAGYDAQGNVRQFDEDGDLVSTSTKMEECVFVNFSRLLTKDEIKKGTFTMELDVDGAFTASANPMNLRRIKLSDTNAENDYFINSPAGDYGILYASSSLVQGSQPNLDGETLGAAFNKTTAPKAGLLFYQAGIAVLSGSIFDGTSNAATATLTIPAQSATALSLSDIDGNTIELIDTAGTKTTLTFDNGTASHSGNKVGISGVGHQGEFEDRIVDSINANLANITATADATTPANTAEHTIVLTQDVKGANGNTIITRSNTNSFQVRLGAANFSKGGGITGGSTGGILVNTLGAPVMNSSTSHNSFLAMLTGSEISASANQIRHRIYNIEFNNTTELNSTVYFCRAHHNEFNYSTNPTYLSSSQIVVKNIASDSPVSYITGIGLYSSDNELLASAKLSEPLRKDPTNELTLRVRLDY